MHHFYDRVRLREFSIDSDPARCTARVALSWNSDRQYVGEFTHPDGSHAGQLQCAAMAAGRALESALDGQATVTIVGTALLQQFDAVVTRLRFDSRVENRTHELIGSCLIRDTAPRTAALTVLDATNQLLGTNLQYLRFRTTDR